MTVYVFRNGNMVEKGSLEPEPPESRSDFPAPRVSRFEAIESPVTGKWVSSWRERDRDMKAADAVDPRDIPKPVFEKRKAIVKRNKAAAPAGHIDV